MGHLLAALNLRPPKHWKVTAGRREVELVETGGAVWDNREVSEAEAAEWIKGNADSPRKAPGQNLPPAPQGAPQGTPHDAPAPAGSALLIPISLSVKVGKKFKYLEVEKLKIEGELKLAGVGAEGALKSADVLGVSLDKGKLAPAKKVEVDLKKLTGLLLGEVHRDSEASSVQVDPKLEFKIGPEELNVALGVSVSSGWYTGSVKFVAVAKEAGKGFEFANFNVAPIGCQVKDREIDLNGVKGKVSGKLTVTLVIKPAWGAIGVDLAQKVGRPVLTTLAEALTAEAAIAAGFVAGAAAQVFAYVKTVSEWQDVRACAKAAENGWLSFRAGFGAVYGLRWSDGGAAALHQAGSAAATQLQQVRLKASRERVRSENGRLPADFDAEYLAALKEKVAQNPDGMGLWIERNFRRQILEGFLQAYADEHRDDYQFKANDRALRTLLGVKA